MIPTRSGTAAGIGAGDDAGGSECFEVPLCSLQDCLVRGQPAARQVLAQRIEVLVSVLGEPAGATEPGFVASSGSDASGPDGAGPGESQETVPPDAPEAAADAEAARLLRRLEAALAGAGPEEAWLAISVLTGVLPEPPAVVRTARSFRLDGPLAALFEALDDSGQLDSDAWPQVEVVTGTVVVDVHHTSRTPLITGIQRVARETINRWRADHALLLTGWSSRYRSLRRLTDKEVDWALHGPPPITGDGEALVSGTVAGRDPNVDIGGDDRDGASPRPVLVPWRCTHIVPELPAEFERAPRYQALARYSRSVTGVIGFDCVPLMAAETSADGMAIGFAKYLAAAANVDRLAAISDAAATEYMGWRSMLAGSGRSGPEIRSIPLAMEPRVPSTETLQRAKELISIGSLPVVLSVGSHEPRKNHLALLFAADTLWREGVEFTLTFIGGNAWKSDAFNAQVETLQANKRPVQTILALPDDLLWGAYRAAYCSVFVSVHEGFGLPVAESLASGTPVITSNFGSMQELGRHGGALLVDPFDDEAITEALGRLLRNPPLRDRLASETSLLPWRSWDDYAGEVWGFLVDGTAPS